MKTGIYGRDAYRRPLVVISILNWNGWRDTIGCLESVQQLTYPDYLMVVTDNGSEDDSVERLRAWARAALGAEGVLVEYTRAEALRGGAEEKEAALGGAGSADRLVLIRNEENLGFAGGHNVAIHYALQRENPAEYVFLLNNDATVERDCLAELVAVAERTGAGLVGATILSADGGAVQFHGQSSFLRQFFAPPLHWQLPPPEGHEGYWASFFVAGAATLIRGETARAIHAAKGEYLESRLFMYCEETPLGWVVQRAGYASVLAAAGRVYHRGSSPFSVAYIYYRTRNRILVAKSLLPMGWRLSYQAMELGFNCYRIVKRVLLGRWREARAIVLGLADGYREITGKWKHHDREARKPSAG